MSDTPPPTSEGGQPADISRRKFMKSAGAVAAGVVVAGVVGGASGYYLGLGSAKGPPPGLKQGTGTLTIGASVSTSGPTAPSISKEIDMYTKWAEMINAQGGIYAPDLGGYIPVKIVVYQDGGPPDLSTVRANYTKLATQDKVDIMVGPFTAAPAETASAVAVQNGIPYIDNQADEIPIFTQPDQGKWVVGSLNIINYWLWNYFNVLKNQTDAKTIYFIDTGDDFGTEVNGTGKSGFGGITFAKQLGFTILGQDSINTSFSPTFDYTAEVLKVKSFDPDVIVFSDPVGVFDAQFWQTCKSQGYKPRAFHPIFGALKAFQGTTGTGLGTGVTGDVLWDPSFPHEGLWGTKFWQKLQTNANFTDNDWPWLSIGYACLEIACAAVTFAGSTDKSAVANALNTMQIGTLLGPWRAQSRLTAPFPPPSGLDPGHGMGLAINIPVQIINGKRTIIGPPDLATGQYQYPEPFTF